MIEMVETGNLAGAAGAGPVFFMPALKKPLPWLNAWTGSSTRWKTFPRLSARWWRSHVGPGTISIAYWQGYGLFLGSSDGANPSSPPGQS
jgi:hypothetical protein